VFAVLVAVLSFGASTSWSQMSSQGTVSVTILGPTGGVVQGAKLVLQGISTNHSRNRETQQVGSYSFVTLPLRRLPDSGRWHYHRGYFLSMLDQFDAAKPEFDLTTALAPHTDIAFLAAAQKSFLAGNLAEAIRVGRAAVQEGHDNYVTLTILSEALIRSGASPDQPDFKEAEVAPTKAVAERPSYASSQIALGYLLLLDNRLNSAVAHLEKGLQLDPRNPSVYSHLAVAYRKLGKQQQSDAMLAALAQLNAEQAARINSAPRERKAIPGSAAGNDRIRP
jgi:tetratricopeptide (TPR) repeat protein